MSRWQRKGNRFRRAEVAGGSTALPGGTTLNWTIPRDERSALRDLVLEIGKLRVLTAPVMQEQEAGTTGAVREIRGLLTNTMKAVAEGSPVLELLSHLRDECNRFLSTVERQADQGQPWEVIREELLVWRVHFADALAEFGTTYGLRDATTLSANIARELRWGFEGPGMRLRVLGPGGLTPVTPPDAES